MGYTGGDPMGVAAIGLLTFVWVLVSDIVLVGVPWPSYVIQAIGIGAGAAVAWPVWRKVLRKYSRLAGLQPKSK